jgi:hypothetical protein
MELGGSAMARTAKPYPMHVRMYVDQSQSWGLTEHMAYMVDWQYPVATSWSQDLESVSLPFSGSWEMNREGAEVGSESWALI